ncbi:BON domain-containing protein [Nitrosomonas sp. Nm166]|uniref:BON domain-containing protein n=1 Tax=Nitrosomonas sp. Nm166 TaxID=1881054 RepID=UPI0008E7569C|nr:BON domain-containing protein [Nitrosomonas sp. Nm166]SFE11927.1 Osmotically-inducible protein OsmY, contains BON domain [Nitrosomonas sp. Nm166]
MKTIKKIKNPDSSVKGILLMAGLGIIVGLMGCQQERSAEKTEQTEDRSVENAGKKIEQLAEQAGQKIDKAGESISQYIDDSAITAKVKTAIIDDPLLKASEIKVTTENGIVRLSGVLDSQEKIDRALEVAQNQENVKSVQNDLTLDVPVQPESEQASQKLDKTGESIGQYIDDSVITAKVKAAIIDDPLLKVFEIKVSTENGMVRLSGVLDSQEKIDRALEVAKNQENVKSVQNDLTLDVPVQPESEQASQKPDEAGESIGQYIDDSVITANVKAAIIDDPLLKASEIKVTTENGMVRLSGVLDSQEKINRALEVAQNQENVKSVQNGLALGVPGQSAADLASQKLDEAKESMSAKMADADQYIDDSAITAKVKAAIIDDPLLKASEIKVTTENGMVRLSGVLDSQEKINRALEVAKNQENVKSVHNDLTLDATEQSQSE